MTRLLRLTGASAAEAMKMPNEREKPKTELLAPERSELWIRMLWLNEAIRQRTQTTSVGRVPFTCETKNPPPEPQHVHSPREGTPERKSRNWMRRPLITCTPS